MDINLEYFKIFYYVAKTGSVTAAAKELHLSQPAVSQALKNFELALGTNVFIRSTKGVKMTQEGQNLYYYVASGYEQILTGMKQYEAAKKLKKGEIRIGASDMTLRFYILPYLEAFCEEYPDIKISVTNAPTPKTLLNLEQGTIDFGVVSTPVEAKEHRMIRKVREIEDIFVTGEKYRQLTNQVLPYSCLREYPYICLEGKTSSRRYVDEFLEKEQVIIKPEFQLATSDMLISFASRGFGIASVVADFAQEALEKGTLYKLKFEKEIPKRQFAIVYDERNPMSLAAQKLMEHMQNEYKQKL
ncbi:MAG: LysR family transcriptional regulator [Lachnospiraceae bacterium]|jgi:DNA-binding transcriptional LysR family regulator|nr:LysR family transcriptional regulator [Lachnospiraceae bacterium]